MSSMPSPLSGPSSSLSCARAHGLAWLLCRTFLACGGGGELRALPCLLSNDLRTNQGASRSSRGGRDDRKAHSVELMAGWRCTGAHMLRTSDSICLPPKHAGAASNWAAAEGPGRQGRPQGQGTKGAEFRRPSCLEWGGEQVGGYELCRVPLGTRQANRGMTRAVQPLPGGWAGWAGASLAAATHLLRLPLAGLARPPPAGLGHAREQWAHHRLRVF